MSLHSHILRSLRTIQEDSHASQALTSELKDGWDALVITLYANVGDGQTGFGSKGGVMALWSLLKTSTLQQSSQNASNRQVSVVSYSNT